MENTGYKSSVGECGEIRLPLIIRERCNINTNDYIEIFINEHEIILKKCTKKCIFCKSIDNIEVFKDKFICSQCKNYLKNNTNF